MSRYDAAMPSAERFNSTGGLRAEAVARIRRTTALVPEVALILGSGLGPLADEIDADASIAYGDIPGFAASTAPGHAGRLVLGRLDDRPVVAMQGRTHFYEGVSAAQCAFPVRVMHALGASSLLVSNACGGLEPSWVAGDLMLQRDFLNATGDNPLSGPNDDELGPRFPIMFDAYDREYLQLAHEVARSQDIRLREGVYLAISGPAYATRAELRAYRSWGADAIGMSTVFEVMAARHEGMRVLGISTVTDMAIPDADEHATGEDVLRTAARVGDTFRRLVRGIVPRL